MAAAQAANPDFVIGESGDASVNKQLNESISDDFGRALLTSLPITLIILLIAFGAVVAAMVPLLQGLTALSRRSASWARSAISAPSTARSTR